MECVVHGEPEPLKMDESRVTSTVYGSGDWPEGECMLPDTGRITCISLLFELEACAASFCPTVSHG